MADVEQNWFHRMRRGEVAAAPVSGLLGFTLRRLDVAAGELDADYTAAPSFLNPAGTVQGGMLAAMLDDLSAGLVDATLGAGEGVVTLNLNLSFVRPAQAGTLNGQARLVRRGRAVCHVNAELSQAGKTVAIATATCSIVAR